LLLLLLLLLGRQSKDDIEVDEVCSLGTERALRQRLLSPWAQEQELRACRG